MGDYWGPRTDVACQASVGRGSYPCHLRTKFLYGGQVKGRYGYVFACDSGHRFALIDERDVRFGPPLDSGEVPGVPVSGEVDEVLADRRRLGLRDSSTTIHGLRVVRVPSERAVFGEPLARP